MKYGKVFLIGAGPGNPELITLKGLNLIKKADVILYDFLIDKKLLTYASKKAELICVGKSRGHHLLKQEEINKLLVEKAKNNKIVVRLKNGDPFIFGRGSEEVKELILNNILYEVIPGVSSSIAVATYCGIPLTHRDYASSFAVITGHRKKNNDEVKFVNADTLVYLMCVTNLKKIINKLLDEGKIDTTPCALIERGTFKNQKVVIGNLKNILSKSKNKKIKSPAIFIVGETVNFFNKYTL